MLAQLDRLGVALRMLLFPILLQLPLTATAAAATSSTPTLTTLSSDTWRVESVREIKDLQRSFSHLSASGRFVDVSALFAPVGVLRWGTGIPNPLADEVDTVANGNIATGPKEVEAWLKRDAGEMDGAARKGSLNLLLVESPVISLAQDGSSAKGRWNALRLMGDGAGATKIEGGIMENEYVWVSAAAINSSAGIGEVDQMGEWKISLLRYYALFTGSWADGWGNVGTGNRTLPIIPYHFTADTVGKPIMVTLPVANATPPTSEGTAAANAVSNSDDAVAAGRLSSRIAALNAEDAVRNLQHAFGYYVDRRMWTDATDLFTTNASAKVDEAAYTGVTGVRDALGKHMGGAAEGLTHGVLNDRPMFMTMVQVDTDGMGAIARGFELGMLGDVSAMQASWEINAFYNRFVKSPTDGLWRIQSLDITRLMVANYTLGWGQGGVSAAGAAASPPFVPLPRQLRNPPATSAQPASSSATSLGDLLRRLARSAAWDSSENESSAYSYFADDIRCDPLGYIHAAKGHKESPGSGWFKGAARIAAACHARYNATDPSPQRPRIPFHWRPQPVITVSADGRSASVRARLVQFGTSNQMQGGFSGVKGFNSGMYADQTVLEAETGTWRMWSTTIDEFYMQSVSWAAGWAAATVSNASSPATATTTASTTSTTPPSSINTVTPAQLTDDYPPDFVLTEPGALSERERGFDGGNPPHVAWPQLVPMWFPYRNPVSGRVPAMYWPGCVPCPARQTWALAANGYQEPSTGPSRVDASAFRLSLPGGGLRPWSLTVRVSAGPGEFVGGVVEVRSRGPAGQSLASAPLVNGTLTLVLSESSLSLAAAGTKSLALAVLYLGSETLSPGQASVTL